MSRRNITIFGGGQPFPIILPPVPPESPLARIGTVGWNPDYTGNTYFGYSFAFVDRFRTVDNLAWTGGGAPDLDSRGYPMPAEHQCECLVNVEGKNFGPADKQTYVIESNKADIYFDTTGSVNKSTTVQDGVTRYQFTLDPSLDYYSTDPNLLTTVEVFFGGFTEAFAANEYISMFRLDEEAEFRTGQTLRSQYLDWHMGFGGNRFMDWMNVNNDSDLSQRATVSSFKWNPRPPLAVMAEYATRVDQPIYLPIPHASSDSQLTTLILYMLANVPEHLPILVECSNEVWNASFSGQYNYAFTVRGGQQVPGTGGGENLGYGWMASVMMAKVLKASGYSPRVQPVLGTQNYADFKTEYILTGIRQAITDWNTSGGPYADVEFASRFKYPSDIFVHLAPATYIDGDYGSYASLGQSDKDIIDDLAARSDGTGVDGVFQQLYHGNVWTPISGTYLDNWTNLFANQRLIAEREGFNLIAYEGQVSSELSTDPARKSLWLRVLHDPRMVQFMEDWNNASLKAGFSATFVLADIAEPNSTFGARDYAYNDTAPRYAGLDEAQSNPIAVSPLSIKVTATGNSQVTRSPLSRVSITGGRGIKKITITGLAPGQYTASRGRLITGKLTTAGVYETLISVVDEWGGSAEYTLTQVVDEAPVLPSGRYLRFEFLETAQADNRNGYSDIDYIGILDADGVEHSAVWAGSNDRTSGLNTQGDGQTMFIGPVGFVDGVFIGDFGSSLSVSSVAIVCTSGAGTAPGKFTMRLTDNSDGTGGNLILDVNEPDQDNWTASGSRRVFEIG